MSGEQEAEVEVVVVVVEEVGAVALPLIGVDLEDTRALCYITSRIRSFGIFSIS